MSGIVGLAVTNSGSPPAVVVHVGIVERTKDRSVECFLLVQREDGHLYLWDAELCKVLPR